MTVKDLLLSDDEAVIEDIMDTNVIFCRTTDERVEACLLYTSTPRALATAQPSFQTFMSSFMPQSLSMT